MDVKEKLKREGQNRNFTYGIFNIDGYNNKGIAIGNKLGLFDNKSELNLFCQYLLLNLTNEDTLKKIMVVDFNNNYELSLLLYCFKNNIIRG